MSVICFFEGPLALTIFRKNKLIDELKIIDAAIDLKQIKYGYLLLFNTKPAEQELENLAKLLSSSSFGELEEYAQKFFESVQDNVFVSPRIGTTSPWSSKATDILKSAGSKSIQRIERIICYSFNGLLNQSVRAEIGDYIIDPMTENWVNNINELSLLFKQTKPANLNHIPINENGIEALDTADVEMGLALSHEEKNI